MVYWEVLVSIERPQSRLGRWLERVSVWATRWSGSSWASSTAVLVIVVWLATGPIFGFSDTWQLVINTSTTIVTFVMVFLIQRAQNKDSLAIQLKLNEIVAAIEGASNQLIDVEDLTEDELRTLHRHYVELAKIAGQEHDLRKSHSVDEAKRRHLRKERSIHHTPPHDASAVHKKDEHK